MARAWRNGPLLEQPYQVTVRLTCAGFLLIVLWMTDCLHPKPAVECGHAAVPEHRRVCLNRRVPCLAVQGDSSMSCCSAPTTHAHDRYLLFFPVSRRYQALHCSLCFLQ